MTVASYLDQWLEDQVAPHNAPTTLRSYRGVVEGHITGKYGIGAMKLRDLTPKAISSLYSALRKRGVGERTRQLAHVVLHRALRDAHRQELIVRNPAALVTAPTYQAKQMTPLTSGQVKKLLAAAKGDRLEALYVVAVFSGAREGELLALTWSDFNADQSVIRIRQSQQDLNGVVSLAPTKTDTSRRTVHLPQIAVRALREHRKRAKVANLPIGPDDRVFTAPKGGPLRRKNMLTREFKPLLERGGIPTTVRFHDLRHSAASLLLIEGVHPKIVQAQLGHARIGVTLDTYSHLIPSLAKGAMSKLDAAFGPRKKARSQGT
jgi:integrase